MGPWCLLICLVEGLPIPNYPWPIYNVAMRETNVTCSHLPKMEKNLIKTKIQSMGGTYTDDLTKNTTHLVTDSVKSQKYYVGLRKCILLFLITDNILASSCRWSETNDTCMGRCSMDGKSKSKYSL